MKKLLLTLLALALLVAPAYAITGRPYSHPATVVVSSSAVGLGTNVCKNDSGQNQALIAVINASVYFTMNDAAATPTSDDYQGNPGDFFELDFPNLFRAIRVTTDAKIVVTCYSGPH